MDVAKDVERALELAVERESWGRKGKLYVSDLKHAIDGPDGDCKRKLWAKLRDEPQRPMTPGVSLMLTAGDLMHEKIAKWLTTFLSDDWNVIAVEERARKNIEPLRGRLDILVQAEVAGMKIVIDVKTKRGAAFNYLQEPKPSDVLQVQAYVKSVDAMGGLLLYVDREGQNWIKVFPVKRDDRAVTEAIEELVRIRDAKRSEVEMLEPILVRADNKGPDSLKVKWPWQVRWCPLEDCHCRRRISQPLPKGIIGYVKNDGTLELKEGYEHMREWVTKKLEESDA